MSTFKHLDQLLSGFVEKQIAGCGCIVAQRGNILYENYFGYADRERNIGMNEQSIHRLFSTTKVIVCTAALLLFERGHFLLNERLDKYLPEFSNMQVVHTASNGSVNIQPAQSPILIKHLFTMTVGLPYPNEETITGRELKHFVTELQREGNYTLEQFIKKIAQAPLLFEPGTNWRYGYGHDILARLIEVVSGMSIEQFLQQELFQPLGMNDTGFTFSGNQAERLVTLYVDDNHGGIKPLIPAFDDERFQPGVAYRGGGTGLFSTPRDYTKFAQMLANGGMHDGKRIIGRKTIDLMRANQLDGQLLKQFQGPYTEGYGYGLGVRTLIDLAGSNGNGSVGEFGWTGMTGTYALIDPTEQLSIVYMHQRFPNLEVEHHLRVRNTVYGCLE